MKLKKLNITLITDNPKSWIMPFAAKLRETLRKKHDVRWVFNPAKIQPSDLAVFLSCETIVKSNILRLSKHNLVVHPSRLPKGRGWSPLAWQILEGKNKIPVTMFEAAESVDSGEIYFQDQIIFEGHELVDELRQKQGGKAIALVEKFVQRYPKISSRAQQGRPSYYRRRTPLDSELQIEQSLKAQFNLLRVADNERYPAFFYYRGHKYVLKIYKAANES